MCRAHLPPGLRHRGIALVFDHPDTSLRLIPGEPPFRRGVVIFGSPRLPRNVQSFGKHRLLDDAGSDHCPPGIR